MYPRINRLLCLETIPEITAKNMRRNHKSANKHSAPVDLVAIMQYYLFQYRCAKARKIGTWFHLAGKWGTTTQNWNKRQGP